LCAAFVAPGHARHRRTVTIAAVGHIVIGTDYPEDRNFLPPGAGEGLIDHVAPLVSYADISVGNLAAPLSERGKVKPNVDWDRRFAFRTPPRYAPVLTELGLDAVLAANNHIRDFGQEAYDDTLGILRKIGVDHVGLVDAVYSRRVRGIKVAVVGFTQPYRPEFQSHHDVEAAGEVIAKLSIEHDVVIALVHGGGEGQKYKHVSRGKEFAGSEYRGRIVELARHMVDRGADLVVGYGAHHPRAMELYEGRIIAYSLGNFLTYGPFDLHAPNYLSLVLQVTLDLHGELIDAQVVPLRLRFPGVPSFDPKGRSIKFLRRMSRRDFPESPLTILEDGTIVPSASNAKIVGR
jgi:hypothetical protein